VSSGDQNPALTLHIPAGQSVALHVEPTGDTGPLLDVIAGVRRPRTGTVIVDDIAVHELSGSALAQYGALRGMVSARFPLRPSLSALDNVLAGAPAELAAEEAARLLTAMGVTRARDPVGVLSAEQQWRVLVARGLRTRPRLVLAESPAGVLDARSTTAILDLLSDSQAQAGFTLLLSIVRLANASYCQRLVWLVDGAVVEDELIDDDPFVRGRLDRTD
jgi:putative ABC transport system ATP-binding protein